MATPANERTAEAVQVKESTKVEETVKRPEPRRADDLFDWDILSKLDYGELKASPKLLENGSLTLRPLNRADYKHDYLGLLAQLTGVGEISEEQFGRQFDRMRGCPDTYYIIVIEDRSRSRIVGSATLHVEFKFIHQTSLRGRIEDVVVDDGYRGQQLGKLLLETVKLLAKHVGCYKLSLDCKDSMIKYYNSLQFVCEPGNSNMMTIRF